MYDVRNVPVQVNSAIMREDEEAEMRRRSKATDVVQNNVRSKIKYFDKCCGIASWCDSAAFLSHPKKTKESRKTMSDSPVPTKKYKTGVIAFARKGNDEDILVAVLGELQVPIVQEPEIWEVSKALTVR